MKFKLEDEPLMVIITSSTGDGEPPSNASKFWRKIRREKNPKFLSHMKYTVLGISNVFIEDSMFLLFEYSRIRRYELFDFL